MVNILDFIYINIRKTHPFFEIINSLHFDFSNRFQLQKTGVLKMVKHITYRLLSLVAFTAALQATAIIVKILF